jgi:hypothetical protein
MFRMTVDDVFSIRGRGTVVTGVVEEGTLRVGDEVLINRHKQVRVDAIEAFRKVLESAEKGATIGLLLSKLNRSEIGPGDLLTGVGSEAEVAPPAPPTPEPQTISVPEPPPVPTPPQAVASGRDPRFAETESQLTQFRSLKQAGLMDDAQIEDSLRGLTFSTAGREWALHPDGSWSSSVDGRQWRSDSPPG